MGKSETLGSERGVGWRVKNYAMLKHCCILCCLLFAGNLRAQVDEKSTDTVLVRYDNFIRDSLDQFYLRMCEIPGVEYLYPIDLYNEWISKVFAQYIVSTVVLLCKRCVNKSLFLY